MLQTTVPIRVVDFLGTLPQLRVAISKIEGDNTKHEESGKEDNNKREEVPHYLW